MNLRKKLPKKRKKITRPFFHIYGLGLLAILFALIILLMLWSSLKTHHIHQELGATSSSIPFNRLPSPANVHILAAKSQGPTPSTDPCAQGGTPTDTPTPTGTGTPGTACQQIGGICQAANTCNTTTQTDNGEMDCSTDGSQTCCTPSTTGTSPVPQPSTPQTSQQPQPSGSGGGSPIPQPSGNPQPSGKPHPTGGGGGGGKGGGGGGNCGNSKAGIAGGMIDLFNPNAKSTTADCKKGGGGNKKDDDDKKKQVKRHHICDADDPHQAACKNRNGAQIAVDTMNNFISDMIANVSSFFGIPTQSQPTITPCSSPQPNPSTGPTSVPPSAGPSPSTTPQGNIHLIKHVIIIMQENRSFDTYFGTYPGAEGFPATYCVPNPTTGHCVKPFHITADVNQGGPHMDANALADMDSGKMDGFVKTICPAAAGCSTDTMDAIGYKDRTNIPNYWSYADNFVLQDHMFQSIHTWSQPTHMSLVSGWAASCTSSSPMSCTSNLNLLNVYTNHAWTDITYLLHKNNISWKYYLDSSAVPQIWNPLPGFNDVTTDGEQGNVVDLTNFSTALQSGTLPTVSWIMPKSGDSEHPPALSSTGQAYVTNLINDVMKSSSWNSTAIFLTWDDWGGFFDHVPPPQVDLNGYGIRTPGLLISPYAKKGFIDKQILSFDAYLKFIEDDFINTQRLDPQTDGRPDSRPDVRENVTQLGDLSSEFDFTQSPRPPLLLATYPGRSQITTVAGARTQKFPWWYAIISGLYGIFR